MKSESGVWGGGGENGGPKGRRIEKGSLELPLFVKKGARGTRLGKKFLDLKRTLLLRKVAFPDLKRLTSKWRGLSQNRQKSKHWQ